MHFSSDVIVMGLPPKVNMLTSFWYSLWGLVSKIRCSEHGSYVLPQCNSNLHKKSFINYCLFKHV